MDIYEAMARRRSLRRFTQAQVENEKIDRILRAAMTAPSSKNSASTRLIVVSDKETLVELAAMRDAGSAFLAGAPSAIVVAGDTTATDLWTDNAAITATYIMLCAEAEGLGSCWVHINGRQRDSADPTAGTASDYVSSLLRLPSQWKPLCAVAIGYSPYSEPRPRPQRDDSERIVRFTR